MARDQRRDAFGREISYLRIAVTDKCNFRCVYCMPKDGVAPRAHGELLTVEEMAHFVALAAGEGIRRVRLTGGEPLVSNRLLPLMRAIRAIPEIEDISLTTNGALLPKLAPELKKAGLNRVNISLDTLDAAQFVQITRLGRLEQTLRGIDAALTWGFTPVKVNCVVVRRLGQDVFGLARLSVDRPIHLRFIEYMPIGDESARNLHAADAASGEDGGLRPDQWDASDTVPSSELRDRINAAARAASLGELEPLAETDAPSGAGPARYWRFPGAAGTVGFISAMSNHFCSACNRVRLTADGAIRPCLFSDTEYQLRDALRAGDDARVLETYRAAVAHKPEEHEVIEGTARAMSQIGG
ncbi:GTP 3',8-cyclase MoaA [Collinsella vaginalis]|uniref:GTP 3',8-cyclase MoaA n=1 Tax=Collinsella vaginalis TaxID=1870987 RepID=UPI000A267BEE|nr:GTP 3',8-cyclase MoaA [Collinsella vaginalis]